MYTKETLTAINSRYVDCGHHIINEIDVAKANVYVNLIEHTRSTTQPKPGDIIRFTDKYGEYYPHAHIEKETLLMGGNICLYPYIPFIRLKANGIDCNTSGGPWHDVPFEKMRHVGKEAKRFCDWGSCGPCADGAIEFEALVSVWEYSENSLAPGYTTETYNRFFVSDSGEDSRYTRETGYRFHVSNGAFNKRAFKNREDLNAWLITFRGKLFDRGEHNSAIVWAWKEKECHVSPKEFDEMNEPIDSMLFNGSVRKCKRVYDEEKHTVTTYFVWYWDEPGDWRENALRQNKIREEKYTFPWDTPEFILAREGR